MPDQALIDRTIVFLNELLKLDPQAIKILIEKRVPCNEALADHPTVQVQAREKKDEPGFAVGVLGIVNGLLGIDADGWGFVCVVVDTDTGDLIEFKRTPRRAVKP